LVRTLPPRRLPWVAASAIPVAVSMTFILLGEFVLSPLFSGSVNNLWYWTLFSDIDYAVGLAVPVFVGFTFRLRFEYSPRGIFVTCAESIYVMGVVALIALTAFSPGFTLLALLPPFVASAFWALLGALLIVAGSGLGRIVLARRQVAPA
jgi:hypothetical protein